MKAFNIAVIGATGAIGSAFVEYLAKNKDNTIHAFSRSSKIFDYDNVLTGNIDIEDEKTIADAADIASKESPLDLVLVAIGLLHWDDKRPEKSIRDVEAENFAKIFAINTIGPALCAKHFVPKLNRDQRNVFAALSARVGSIGDNNIGGWYAYRASKAALNMVIKTTSIEAARRNKKAAIIGLHPGTVQSRLSEPFSSNVPENKLFTPEYSVQNMMQNVVEKVGSDDTGKLFAYNGEEIQF